MGDSGPWLRNETVGSGLEEMERRLPNNWKTQKHGDIGKC